MLDDDDAQNALQPERFYWLAQFVSAMLIAFAFMALTIAAHLVGAVEDRAGFHRIGGATPDVQRSAQEADGTEGLAATQTATCCPANHTQGGND